MDAQAKRRFGGLIIFIGGGTILILLIGFATVFCGVDPNAPPKPTQRPATRVPTTMPTPPSEPKAKQCPTTAALAYFDRLDRISTVAADAMAQLSILNSLAASDINLVVDAGWREQVAIELGILQSAASDMENLGGPISVRKIHNNQVLIAGLLHEGAQLYATGIDNLDPNLLGMATDKMNDATALTLQNATLIESLCR